MSSSNSSVVGKIAEFIDTDIVLKIYKTSEDDVNSYILKIRPSTRDYCMNVSCNMVKDRYSGTPSQAKQHIKDAIEIAKLSTYASTHFVKLTVPHYPNLIVPVEKIDTALHIIDRIINNYM